MCLGVKYLFYWRNEGGMGIFPIEEKPIQCDGLERQSVHFSSLQLHVQVKVSFHHVLVSISRNVSHTLPSLSPYPRVIHHCGIRGQ